MTLPDPCEKCVMFEGNWMETEAGLQRCACARGKALASERNKSSSVRGESVVSSEQATICVEIMSEMEFFPSAAGARAAIASELMGMCQSAEHASWLAMRMIRLYRKWPSVVELRQVYCAQNQPLDGIEAIGTSEVYPDGIPAERPDRVSGQLEAQGRIAAPLGGSVSSDSQMSELAQRLSESQHKVSRLVPVPRITQTTIDQLVCEQLTRRIESADAGGDKELAAELREALTVRKAGMEDTTSDESRQSRSA